MNDCPKIRALLPLAAGGDLDAAGTDAVRRHVAICGKCRLEEEKFLSVIFAARKTVWDTPELPAGVRYRIATESAENVRRGRWAFLVPRPWLMAHPGTLVAVTACLVALLTVPVLRRDLPGSAREAEISPRIDIVADSGVVRLAWSDGERSSYTVVKSTDPRDISRGEAHVVRGNVWIDHHPDSSPVVFYRIE